MDVKLFCEDSSAHGLKKIVSAQSKVSKTFWVTVFAVAIGALLTHLYLRIHDFTQFKHQEVTYTSYSDNLEYPDVTICNINPFSPANSQLERQLREDLLEKPFAGDGECMKDQYSGLPNRSNISRSYTEALAATAGFEAIGSVSHRKEDFIVKCDFVSLSCSADDFTSFIDSHYYQCHTISLNKMVQRLHKMSKKPEPGGEFGLSLILFLDAASPYDNGTDYRQQMTSQNTAGARVAIHRTGTNPRLVDYGLDISSGFSTAIALAPLHYTRKPYPYQSNCTEKEELDNSLVYTQNDCVDHCIQKKIRDDCGCISVNQAAHYPNSTLPICGSNVCNVTDWQCYHRHQYEESNADCLSSCPRPCTENSYLETTSSSYWPGDDYQASFYVNLFLGNSSHPRLIKALGNPDNETIDLLMANDLIRKNFVRLNVFMETFYVRYTQEEAIYELVVLLADFGGTLGLWAGISFISVIELLELVFIGLGKKVKKVFNLKQVAPLQDSK